MPRRVKLTEEEAAALTLWSAVCFVNTAAYVLEEAAAASEAFGKVLQQLSRRVEGERSEPGPAPDPAEPPAAPTGPENS